MFYRFFGRPVIPADVIFQKSNKLLIPDILSYIPPDYDSYRSFYEKNKTKNFLILYQKKHAGKQANLIFFFWKKKISFFLFFSLAF